MNVQLRRTGVGERAGSSLDRHMSQQCHHVPQEMGGCLQGLDRGAISPSPVNSLFTQVQYDISEHCVKLQNRQRRAAPRGVSV